VVGEDYDDEEQVEEKKEQEQQGKEEKEEEMWILRTAKATLASSNTLTLAKRIRMSQNN